MNEDDEDEIFRQKLRHSDAVVAWQELGDPAVPCPRLKDFAAASNTPCNWCGLTCSLGSGNREAPHGLIRQTVSGGYESTPGNGHGALDDCTSYTFSLCEFCLDWMFSQFQVGVHEYSSGVLEPWLEPWRPAAVRVAEDEWRRQKEAFTDESHRRALARTRPETAETRPTGRVEGRVSADSLMRHVTETNEALEADDDRRGVRGWKRTRAHANYEDLLEKDGKQESHPSGCDKDWKAIAEALLIAHEVGENIDDIRRRFGLEMKKARRIDG